MWIALGIVVLLFGIFILALVFAAWLISIGVGLISSSSIFLIVLGFILVILGLKMLIGILF